MGPTLFRYILGDLVKVLLLAALALAGVMSFAGLIRPVVEHGLGHAEALRLLLFALPAMMAYGLPVAALFATTFVYGRLAADNEATAVVAAGVPASLAGLLLPSVALAAGLGAAAVGLFCFVVPAANLQIEQTVFANLARGAASAVDRTNRITLFNTDAGNVTIVAERAVLPDAADLAAARAAAPDDVGALVGDLRDVQVVRLENGSIVRHADRDAAADDLLTFAAATVYIEPPSFARGADAGGVLDRLFGRSPLGFDEFGVTVVLEGGLRFPRGLGVEPAGDADAPQPTVAAAAVTQFGPIYRESPLRENPKFLDVRAVRDLLRRPERSRRVQRVVRELVAADQRRGFLRRLDAAASSPGGAVLDDADSTFRLTVAASGDWGGDSLDYRRTPVRLEQVRRLGDGGVERLAFASRQAQVEARPLRAADGGRPAMLVTVRLADAEATVDDRPAAAGAEVERRATVPMPDDLASLASLTAQEHLNGLAETRGGTRPTPKEAAELLTKRAEQDAELIGELHARAASIAACLFLPPIGAGLGLLFRSGNFLGAFAVSLAPAALCVLVVLVGQKAAEDVAEVTPEVAASAPAEFRPGPSPLRLALIWSGDAAVVSAGAVLLWRVRRG